MKRIFSVLIFALISNSTLAAPEIKGNPQELRGFLHPSEKVVTISGQAEEKAYSDKAVISLVITTENKLLSQAISTNSMLRKELTALLLNSGITQDAIKSSKFSSSPQYGWFGSKPSSYKIVNRMAISIFQESHLKAIATAADKHPEAELSDTAFEHTKKDEFNAKVKAKALQSVIKQKEFYEQSLGLKLTPIGIRDANIRSRGTRGAMVLEDALKLKRGSLVSEATYRAQAQESSFDEVKYEANLSIDFKIEQ